ncbi:MAG: TRAP transporter substrate-binding protein [Bacillota bacterium]
MRITSRFKAMAILMGLLSIAVLVAGCGSGGGDKAAGGNDEAKVITAKLGHVGAPDHIFEIGAKKFSELVEQKTNGKLKIETYPGGQLGNDRDMMESLKMGTIEFAIEGPIDSFLPKASIVMLPYMFNGPEHVYKFLDGPLGDEVFAGLNDMGIVPLGHMENGWRLITSNKPINSMSDLKGQKIRVPESPMFQDSFKAFGASPVPVPFTELYSALQQGVADGQENPVFHIHTNRFYEVQKYLALSKHMYLNAPLLASQKFWDTLDPEMQKAVQEAAKEAVDYQRKVAMEKESELLGKLKEAGMTVTEPDLTPFKEAVKPVHEKWANEHGQDLYNKIAELGK